MTAHRGVEKRVHQVAGGQGRDAPGTAEVLNQQEIAQGVFEGRGVAFEVEDRLVDPFVPQSPAVEGAGPFDLVEIAGPQGAVGGRGAGGSLVEQPGADAVGPTLDIDLPPAVFGEMDQHQVGGGGGALGDDGAGDAGIRRTHIGEVLEADLGRVEPPGPNPMGGEAGGPADVVVDTITKGMAFTKGVDPVGGRRVEFRATIPQAIEAVGATVLLVRSVTELAKGGPQVGPTIELLPGVGEGAFGVRGVILHATIL